MKKLFLLGLSLSTLSFATSIRSVSVELVDVPLYSGVGNQAEIIRTTFDGVVYGAKCSMKSVHHGAPVINYSSCHWTTVKYLSRYEIREVARLVKAAEHGPIVTKSGYQCFAMPMRTHTIYANNKQFLLESGSFPCGNLTFNNTRAAMELAKMAKEWQQDACH